MRKIEVIDRSTGELFEEVVAGRAGLEYLLSTSLGGFLLESIVKRRWFSSLYGLYQESSFSRRAIQPFIELLGIDMEEAQKEIHEYGSFNDFFIRTLHPHARPFDSEENRLILPADGRITVIEKIEKGQVFQIKGVSFQLDEFLQDQELALDFEGGSMLIVRLCPADYHRFHFPCEGIAGPSMRIAGHLYSVNPLAIEARPGLFTENERQISILENEKVGKILYAEVGATMVGKIVQTYSPGQQVQKGSEKGYFKFGASTTVLILPPGKVKIDEDLVENSKKGWETLDKMGQGFATILDTGTCS